MKKLLTFTNFKIMKKIITFTRTQTRFFINFVNSDSHSDSILSSFLTKTRLGLNFEISKNKLWKQFENSLTLNSLNSRQFQIVSSLLEEQFIQMSANARVHRIKQSNWFNSNKISFISICDKYKCRTFWKTKFFCYKHHGAAGSIIIHTI